MNCPKCETEVDRANGSPVSPYIDTYTCPKCGWVGLRCGETTCDGYLAVQEVGSATTVRYNCVKCGWTGTGPRFRLMTA